jgi:2-desacetyl-2-hydroxyethyl bacteriochlorophyllide A dehydrogenase
MTLSSKQSTQVCFINSHTLDFVSENIKAVGPREILLKTLVSGISAGTEGMWYKGTASALKSGRKSYPYFPGYELVGEVIEKGDEVADVSVGDKIFAMKPHASHALLNEKDIFFKIPPNFNLKNALAIALTGTALHAAHRANLMVGDQCAVVGMGVLGFVLLQVLSKAMSCSVTAVSQSLAKKELALHLGASEVIEHAQADNYKKPMFCTFDTTGTNTGIETAVKLVQPQGEIIATGFYNDPVKVDGELLFTKELTLKGVRGVGSPTYNLEFNRWDRMNTMRLASNLVFNNSVAIDSLITHTFKAQEIAKAYQLIADQNEKYIQIVVDWTDA